MGLKPRLKKPRVYFAHSMKCYATAWSRQAEKRLRKIYFPGWRIINPENLNWQALVSRLGSHEAVYQYVIDNADAVVVQTYQDHVGRGVYEEARRALQLGKPVYQLVGGGLLKVYAVTQVDPTDWAVRYGRLRVLQSFIQEVRP